MHPQELVKKLEESSYKDRDFVRAIMRVTSAKDGCDPMYHEFFGDFYDETRGFADKLVEYFEEFERGQMERRSLDEAYRLTHTIKGASATMGFGSIACVAEGLEDLFGQVRDGSLTLDGSLVDVARQSLQLISQRLEELKVEMPAMA